MWPWGHAALGYILYRVYLYYRGETQVRGLAVVVLAIGTQFPDLVDKPLAWTFGILQSGRSLGHSVVTTGVVVGVCWYVARSTGRRYLVSALAVGIYGHLLGDGIYPTIAGDFRHLGFLVWPFVPPVDIESSGGIIAHLLAVEPTPTVLFELGLTCVAVGLWYRDGMPGLRELTSRVF